MTGPDPFVPPHAVLPVPGTERNRRRNLVIGAATLATMLLAVLLSLDPAYYGRVAVARPPHRS